MTKYQRLMKAGIRGLGFMSIELRKLSEEDKCKKDMDSTSSAFEKASKKLDLNWFLGERKKIQSSIRELGISNDLISLLIYAESRRLKKFEAFLSKKGAMRLYKEWGLMDDAVDDLARKIGIENLGALGKVKTLRIKKDSLARVKSILAAIKSTR